MLGWILLLIGAAGFGAAGYMDLKTTEFPDWLPYVMITGALASRGAFAFMTGDLSVIIDSVLVGCVFLGLGMAMYFTKQWGDGDAWLLGALGFLFPAPTGFSPPSISPVQIPFPAVMLFNFFLISFFYLIAYSFALGALNPRVTKRFKKHLKSKSKTIVSAVIVFILLCAVISIYISMSFGIPAGKLAFIAVFPPLFAGLLVFVHYGKFIEGNLFRKRIKASDLRPGDVPVGRKWRVLSDEDVRRLKKRGGHIWIKEGIRFAPVFIITLLLSLFFGNMFFALAGLY